MRILLTIFWIITGFLILGLFSLNVGQTVDVNLLVHRYENVSLISVTFVALFLGVLISVLIFMLRLLKLRHQNSLLQKEVRRLQQLVAESKANPEADRTKQVEAPDKPDNIKTDQDD